MQTKHSFLLKYKLMHENERLGLVTADSKIFFLECEGIVDFVAVEQAAKIEWAKVLALTKKYTAFSVKDPQLICETTFSGVSWE